MNSSIRRIGTGLFALGFAALLASCGGGDGGGGGNNPILIFFGMNNDERCTSVVIDVDVDVANSILSRNGNAVDCLLNATLDSNGCDVSFSEIDGGNTLRVTISGCNVPAVTNLYQCNFDDADLSELAEATDAQCICQSPPCDTTPPICVSRSISPGSCEDCDNNQDDDDNDLVDCDDPNCEHSPVCEGVTTTTDTTTTSSTTSSTTTTETVTTTTNPGQTTTTTTLGPTTTTTIPGPQQCTATFRLIDNVNAASLQWDTDYSAVDGGFVGDGEAVECFGLVDQALPAFFDNEDTEVLSSGLIKLTGIDGPADLAECTLFATSSPSFDDFDITVTEASDPDVIDIIPLPDVVVSELSCVSVTTTTNPGETTTTIPGETTTTIPGQTTTTTIPPTGTHRITFRLLTSSGPLNALQLRVDYETAPGEFVGELELVDCQIINDQQVFAPNDEDAERELTMGIIALAAFSAQVDLINCSFEATDELANPLPTDFDVTVIDSTNEAGQTIAVTIGVTVIPTP